MNKTVPHFPQTEILRKIPGIWWCSGAERGRPDTAGRRQTSFMKEQAPLTRFGCLSYCDFDLFERLNWKQTRGFMWLRSHLSNDVLISESCLWLRIFDSFPTPLLDVLCLSNSSAHLCALHGVKSWLRWGRQRRMDNDVNVTQIQLGTPGAVCSGDKPKKIISNLTPRSLGKYCRSFFIIHLKKNVF